MFARFPAAAGRTVVALLGVTPALVGALDPAEAATLPAPGFVLAVGTLEPRKNLPRLVDAYGRLPAALAGPTSARGRGRARLGDRRDARARCARSASAALLLGYVTDAALAELYRRCAVFCYPSLGEGFGLPVLEAMAAGAAVLTSNLSSLPEVGGDAVDYVDPRDMASIAAGLRRALEDEPHRAELGSRARARSAEFSWKRFAETVLSTLDLAARQ